jgi:ABC-2 type transport system permease protein
MSGSLKRIGAILIKELQEFKSNTNVLIMYLLPVIIFVIFKGLINDMPTSLTISFSLVMLVGEVCVFVPAMLIAEEKEKKTLNVLMISPARPFEVFAGKGLITFLTVMLTAVILSLMAGAGLQHMPVILIGTALVTIVCTFLGMIIGLFAQNQMATGMIGLPVIFPFIMMPYLTIMGNETITKIAHIIPTYYYFKMIDLGLSQQKGLGDMLPHIGALAFNMLISFGLLLMIYRKRGFES